MNLSLRKKLTLWITITAAFAFAVAALLQYFYNAEKGKISDSLENFNDIYVSIISCRNTQNDFFNIDTQKPRYYLTHNSPNIEKYTFEYENLKIKFSLLKKQQFVKKSGFVIYLNMLESYLDSSNETFLKMNILLLQRGFKDEGVIGQMRTCAHQIEAYKGVNTASLLMLRRHEKDFMLRNDSIYVTKYKQLITAFSAHIAMSNIYSSAEKKELLELTSCYGNMFFLMVALDKKLGLKDNTALKLKLDQYYTQLQLAYNSLKNNASCKSATVFAHFRLLYLISFITLFALVIFVSIKTTALLSAPLRQVTKYIATLRNSNLEYNPVFKGIYTSREIEMLNKEFSMLLELLKVRVHERDQAEKKLRYNVIKFREITEMLPQSLFETDENGFITYANQAFIDTFKYLPTDINEGLNIASILSVNDIDLLFQQPNLREKECVASLKDNTPIHVIIYSIRIIKDGIVQGIRCLIIDDSLRHKYVIELEQARAKAEQSDKLKSLFLANMSHEIRTPMNAIIGFTNLLSESEYTRETQNEYLGYIKSSGEHLLTIIEDIIDIAKIEAGELKIKISSFDVHLLLDELRGMFENIASQKGKHIEIVAKKEFANKFIIHTDEWRLRQILINLVGNAIKFTNAGYVEYGYNVFGDVVQFYIKDTGVGIPETMHSTIFDRFMQLDNVGRGGTGLGLHITKQLVHLLNGNIWLHSLENKGTTFFFTLPLSNVTSIIPKQINIHTDMKTLSGLRMLVAENNDMNYLLLEKLFIHSGIKISRAHNGKEAIKMSTKNFDLILLDMQIPLINGFEAVKEIKRRNPEIPVIAQTAFAYEHDRVKCLTAGCDDYISKPIQKEKLFQSLSRFAKKQNYDMAV